MKLIIHVNAFTSKIDSGYIMVNGKKSGPMMTKAEVVAYLAGNLETPVEFTKV